MEAVRVYMEFVRVLVEAVEKLVEAVERIVESVRELGRTPSRKSARECKRACTVEAVRV